MWWDIIRALLVIIGLLIPTFLGLYMLAKGID